MNTKYSHDNYIFHNVEWVNFDYNSLKYKVYDLIFAVYLYNLYNLHIVYC